MTNPVTPYRDKDRSKKAQVEEMFDSIAARYDLLNHVLSLGIDRLWRKKAIRHLKPHKPQVIMDMATGTGDFAFEALSIHPKKILAVDLSDEMLSVGRRKSRKKQTEEIISFEKGDAENLAYPDGSIDAITVGFGVRNYENLEKGLREMNRVLKPGGHLVILEISKPTSFPLKQVFGIYFKHILPTIGKMVSKDARAYTYLPESVEAFPEGKRFVEILQKTGYKEAKWKPLTFGICAMYTCVK